MANVTINPLTGEMVATSGRGCNVEEGELDNKTGFISLTIGGCFRAMDGSIKKKVRMRFVRDRLLYDIKNAAFVVYDVMDSEEARHAKHQVADICEKGNIDRVNRTLSLVITEVENLLHPLTQEAVTDEELDNIMEEPVSYDMLLHVPNDTSRATLRYLVNLVHEYMVARVLSDWLSIVNAKAAEYWTAKAQLTKDQIEDAKPVQRAFLRTMYP